MPDTFNFIRTDPRLVKYLSQQELNQVAVWQNMTLAYQFEFHTMHTIGHPVYLREAALSLNSNLPKIDTKGKTPTTLVTVNSDRINDPACLADFQLVVRSNLALFQKLAEPYYDGETVAKSTPDQVKTVCYKCTRDNRTLVYIKVSKTKTSIPELWLANVSSKLQRPNCTMHKTKDCMGGPTLVDVKYNEWTKLNRIYNDNWEIQDG